jgi:hypothetical protein
MHNASALGSLAQHSGDFVRIFVCVLMVMTASQFQTTHVVRSSTTETKKITVQPIPKAKAPTGNTGRKFHCQWPTTRAGNPNRCALKPGKPAPALLGRYLTSREFTNLAAAPSLESLSPGTKCPVVSSNAYDGDIYFLRHAPDPTAKPTILLHCPVF